MTATMCLKLVLLWSKKAVKPRLRPMASILSLSRGLTYGIVDPKTQIEAYDSNIEPLLGSPLLICV